ncbi:hypothetical protein Taro_013707, partial [Colocasia esculenta]|nr:hypothetical protein [Colocasia esculenta]
PSASAPPVLVAGAFMVSQAPDAISLQEGESYSQQMTEKYAGEEEQPQLDPEVWVAASSAPKKDHVYGFGHSMDTSRVLSGASSSGSQATSAFITPGAPGTTPSEVMSFIQDEIFGLESCLVHMMHTQVSDAV